MVAKSSNDPPRSNCQSIPRVLTLEVPLTASSSSLLVCRAKRGLPGRVPPQKMLTGTGCAREGKGREGRIDLFPMRRKSRRRSKRSRRRRARSSPRWCCNAPGRDVENKKMVIKFSSIKVFGQRRLVEKEFRPMILSVRRGKESLPLTSTGEENLTKKNKGCKVQNHVKFWFCPILVTLVDV